MWTPIARVILRQKVFLLIIIGLATMVMGYQASKTGISYQFSRILPVDDPAQVDYVNFQKNYGDVSNTVVLAIKAKDFYNAPSLKAWEQFGEDLKTIEGITGVLNLTNAPDLFLNESTQKLEIQPLLSVEDYSLSADSLKKKIQDRPFYSGLLYSQDQVLNLMTVSLKQEYLYNKNIIRIVEAIKKKVAIFEAEKDVEVFVSGLPYVRMANTLKLKREVYLFIALTVIVTAIILLFFLKSTRATLISLLVVVIGVVFSFGLIESFGFEITLLSSLIPPLVIVIGIPNCIFLINKYHAEYRIHKNQVKALQRVIRKIGGVTFLTNVTTSLGFAAFILTDSTTLVEFGLVTSLNILVVYTVSLILIPIMYTYMPEPVERHYKHLDRKWITRMIDFLIHMVKHQRVILFSVSIVLVVLGIWGLSKIETTGNLTNDFSRTDPVFTDLKVIENHFNGVVPFEILVDTKRKKGIQKLGFLKRLSALQLSLDSIPELSRSLSIVDFLKAARQAFYGNNPDFYGLPNSQDKDWVFSSLPRDQNQQGSLMQNLADSTQQVARITLQVADISSPEMRILRKQIEEKVERHLDPERYAVTYTGASVIFLKGTNYLIKNLILSLSMAIFVISLIMAMLFGSIRMVFISLIPNLIPLIMTAGIMGFFGIPLKPSTILVFSIAFGISVDDTIHFLAKYRQELKENGWRIGKAVVAAIKETGVSMFYTSMVLFFGFSIFMWSEFGGSVALGLLVSITLLFAMFSNLLILPGLLMVLEKFISAKEFSEGIIEIVEGEDDDQDDDDSPDSDRE